MKLNIGSGYKRIPEFLNVDHDPLVEPDFLVDLENLKLPIEDNTVDYIIAHHILEHIGPGFFPLMQELYRICKHDAIIDIKVPHYRSDVQHMDASHVRTITVDMMQQFSKKYNRYHIENWNSSSGFGLKFNVDFEIVQFRNVPYPKWFERFKTMTEEEIQEVSENFNNVYMQTDIIMRAVKDDEKSISNS